MRKIVLISIVLVLKYFSVSSQVDLNTFLNQITIESIKNHVDTLASESMEGRYSGNDGQKLAAKYISQQFTNYGLNPVSPDNENPFFQKFGLYKYQTGESTMYYNNLVYTTPVFFGSKNITDSITDEIVFTGFANEKDLKSLNISNKSIFFLSESVKDAISKSKVITSSYNVNFCIVGIPFGKKLNPKIFNDKIDDLESFKELFYYHNFFVLKERNKKDFKTLRNNNTLIPDFIVDSEDDVRILFVPEKLVEGLFQKNYKDLEKIAGTNYKTENNNLKSIKPAQFSLKINYSPSIDSLQTENIIGFIDSENTDNSIIVGAHYDHIGRNYNYEINYGADDNASGTTGMLTIAKLLSQATKDGIKLKKDIVFIAYSAEELGLHGSEYYVQNPVFPLQKTDLVFNLDMIGRNMDDDPENSNRVFLLKWKGGAKYIKNVKKLNNEYTALIVDKSPGLKNRILWTFGSDHYSFVKNGISSVTYFTALHNDYHTPGDTPDKLNYDKMNRIVKLVFLNIWDLSYKGN
ncbi:MAG: M28 family peptidase [Bacteroidales bacterium]|nr:M28 family peptidase [Bacteroidales bacterium]